MADSSTSSSSASPLQRLSHRLRCPSSSSAAPPRAREYRAPPIVESEEEFDRFPRPYGYISSESELEDDGEEMREVPEPADAFSMTLTDPEVLKCPICFEPLCSPVFQVSPKNPGTRTVYKNVHLKLLYRSQFIPLSRSNVWVGGLCFVSPDTFSNRKTTEQNVGKHALIWIQEKLKNEGRSRIIEAKLRETEESIKNLKLEFGEKAASSMLL